MIYRQRFYVYRSFSYKWCSSGERFGPTAVFNFFDGIRITSNNNILKCADDCKVYSSDPLELSQYILDVTASIAGAG